MENMKNIVVLKNIPSNLVEEAIVVLKENQKSKKYEYIEKSGKTEIDDREHKFTDCVTKEAEMVISEYLSKIEKNKKRKENEKIIKKYEASKKMNIVLGIILTISLILNLI